MGIADAAERMKEAGLDGVEFECYGHLMDQFVSPLTNALAHPYGGSFDNRLRFAMDVLEACRKRVGPAFLLGVRYTADEEEKGGISVEDGVAMAHNGSVHPIERLREYGFTDAHIMRALGIGSDCGTCVEDAVEQMLQTSNKKPRRNHSPEKTSCHQGE